MQGVTLSRWTMSYFATALVGLLAALGLMVAGYGYPASDLRSPQTLLLVHTVVLGWLTILLGGALFQFVPVMVARPLHSNTLPLPTLICIVSGIFLLLAGFAQLGSVRAPQFPFFALASALLAAAFSLLLWNLGLTLWKARPWSLPARFVVLGLCSAAFTAAFGIVFALVLGGHTGNPTLVRLFALGLPIHAALGLGGWLTLTAIGVSYRLLAMFMLAPEDARRSSRIGFHAGAGAIAMIAGGGTFTILSGRDLGIVLAASALLALIALACYAVDVLHLYRKRQRRTIELNSRTAAAAVASLVVAGVLLLGQALSGRLASGIGADVFLLAFGWLSGLGLAQLYKIVPFLTWLECYGPVLGRKPTPRVQDIVIERHARGWFALYFVAVWIGTAMLLMDAALAFRGCAAFLMLATLGICRQLLRARSLRDVPGAPRLPDGASRPRLLFASSAPR